MIGAFSKINHVDFISERNRKPVSLLFVIGALVVNNVATIPT